jgi:hypothetical protein
MLSPTGIIQLNFPIKFLFSSIYSSSSRTLDMGWIGFIPIFLISFPSSWRRTFNLHTIYCCWICYQIFWHILTSILTFVKIGITPTEPLNLLNSDLRRKYIVFKLSIYWNPVDQLNNYSPSLYPSHTHSIISLNSGMEAERLLLRPLLLLWLLLTPKTTTVHSVVWITKSGFTCFMIQPSPSTLSLFCTFMSFFLERNKNGERAYSTFYCISAIQHGHWYSC